MHKACQYSCSPAFLTDGPLYVHPSHASCRRKKLLGFFGEKDHSCSPPDLPCDYCQYPQAVSSALRKQEEAVAAKSVAAACRMAGQSLAGAHAQEEQTDDPPDPVLAGMACNTSSACPPHPQHQRPRRAVPQAAWSCALSGSRSLPAGPSPGDPMTDSPPDDIKNLECHHNGLQQQTGALPHPMGADQSLALSSACSHEQYASLLTPVVHRLLKVRNQWTAPEPVASESNQGSRLPGSKRSSSQRTTESVVQLGISGQPVKPVMKRIRRGGFVPPRPA